MIEYAPKIMKFYLQKLIKIGVIFTVLLVFIAAGEPDDDNTLKRNIDFDLVQVLDATPVLRIRRRSVNDGSYLPKKNYEKRALRGGSSSESDENIDDKEEEEEEEKGKENIRIRDSESEDVESSDSGNDRRWSTKGPDNFDPEINPSIHGRYKKDSSESE